METALPLDVVARGGPAAERLLEYVVSGDRQPLFDGLAVDRQLGPDGGWALERRDDVVAAGHVGLRRRSVRRSRDSVLGGVLVGLLVA
jgi:hypothetical protein